MQQPNQVCAVLGAQWGDEGKGKLVDVLAAHCADIVARFNGGNNAGHTIVVEGNKYAFHLLPCGVIYPHTINLLGNGMVIHLPSLFQEMDTLSSSSGGTTDIKGRLKVSDRAHLLFDFHIAEDAWLENCRGSSSSIGTTRKGIGPAYTSKASRNSIRVGELVGYWDVFLVHYRSLAGEVTARYGDTFTYDREAEVKRLYELRQRLLDENMVVDGTYMLHQALKDGKRILCEGANAVMLDLDHGTYPYVTSSSTTVGGVCTGLGIPPRVLVGNVIGVVKAYTTRVGRGPFPTELTDEDHGGMAQRETVADTDVGTHLQRVGREVGTTTGRKRRCGWLDMVVLRYSHGINGYSAVNLTKLDVLTGLEEIRIGVAYERNGVRLPEGQMPASLHDLGLVTVVYETMPGWTEDITHTKVYDELPIQARNYVERVEQLMGVPIIWIGVGPGREEMIIRGV
jgi:adenylosuccinate synthase